jgi:hypothetical protein
MRAAQATFSGWGTALCTHLGGSFMTAGKCVLGGGMSDHCGSEVGAGY